MQKEYWFVGLQPDQIVDAKGDHVGFTDVGWCERIIKIHNESIDACITEYKPPHKSSK